VARKRLTGGERREAIVRAAVRVFGRAGFAGATTRELAREAGVSEAMIFRYFPHKAALYRAIIDRFISGSGDPFPRHAAETRQDHAVLAGLADNLICSAEEDPCFVRLLLYSALEGHALSRLFLDARVLKVTRTLARYIAARRSEGALRGAGSPLLAARTFLGMPCYYALMNTLYGHAMPGRMPRRRAAALFATLFLEGSGSGRARLRTVERPVARLPHRPVREAHT
jgi:AcrR family transcriptional regulator